MYGLRRFGIKLGLSTIRNILQGLGNPQDSFNCIHVAGTNGKGSIASTLSSILHASGYKVGLYTSPHLVKFNERICIDNKQISDQDVVAACQAVRNVPESERELTYFEYATAMALYEFKKYCVDWAVIETGMGGRLDATNMVRPAVCVISNISIEHSSYLGNTISAIAGEKGGIIKKGTPVVTGARQKEAIQVLRRIAAERNAPIYRLGKEFRVRRDRKGTFTYYGINAKWSNMHTGLLGNYQVDNTALVLAVCEIIKAEKAGRITLESIKQGIDENRWPGRLEVVSESPYVILDGAHNLVAAKNLSDFLLSNINNRHLTLVIGVLDDKPYEAILKSLLPVCSKVILTRPTIDRSLDPEKLYPIAKKMVKDVKIIPDVAKAVSHAVKTSSSDDAVCIAGSLYVVGEAKEKLDLSALVKYHHK